LYERDAAADARRKGYAIGLKGDAGFSVLERLGLLDDVLSIGAEQVTNFVITDRQGRTLLALPSGNDARHRTYRVQRDHLQSVLADTLTTTPVHFGFEAVGYETIDTRHRVVFTGGRHVDGDVVVGCDGVGSVLRRQIVDDSSHFLGISAITGDAALTVDDRLLSGGYFMTFGRPRRLVLLLPPGRWSPFLLHVSNRACGARVDEPARPTAPSAGGNR
jgi:2-polyprenyl-6-methoxyphenol hydroxylase-like FAD-dependent oxidoreductase